MNGYRAFYYNTATDIYAPTRYEAWQKAVTYFKAPKSKQHMVHVHLCEREDGSTVSHSTSSV